MKYIVALLMMTLIPFSGCRQDTYPLIPGSVRNTIDLSGRNNIEFMRAIVGYRSPEDSLQLKSLYYLLSGLPQHGYRTYLLQDSTGELLDYNIREAPSYDSLLKQKSVLKALHGPLHFKRYYFGKDVYKIDASYLVDHIDRRYRSWQHNRWSANYSFDDFLEYILPHRTASGPLDDWHTVFADTLLQSVNIQSDNPSAVADTIIGCLGGYLDWDARYIENPTDQGWQEMKSHRQGRSEDMAAFVAAALRTFGIAASVDYLPLAQESAHQVTYWVAIHGHQGAKSMYYPFSDTLEIPRRFPKVFRRKYQSYNKPLPPEDAFLGLQYHHMEDGKYRDVTNEYMETTTVEISKNLFEPQHDFSRVFLNVSYGGNWIPVAWKYYLNRLVFTNIVPGFSYALTDKHGNILYQFQQ